MAIQARLNVFSGKQTISVAAANFPKDALDKRLVSPAMVEAGLVELSVWALDDSHVSADCISEVYVAMERARLATLRKRRR